MNHTGAIYILAFLVTIIMLARSFKMHVMVGQRMSQGRRMRVTMREAMTPVRVRFAPSPTGSLHVGGARTALFNWLLAKQTKGTFIIRVEDTDEARSTRESEKSILDDLKWMNMSWDEGPEIGGPHAPYRQSERKDIYKKFAEQLIADGHAFRCFCTDEELEQKRAIAEEAGVDAKYDGTWRDADPALVQQKLDQNEPYTVRFKVPRGKVVFIDDKVRGRVTWDVDASLGDFIIMRSNGMPVYNFCVSVDDADMQVTHVIRAEEHLSNTLRQMLILEALKFTPPVYAHCSLILGSDRSKLSKRHGATSVKQFSEQGFLPAAMMNYLANLGWNDGTDKEIYSPEELCAAFDLNRIVKSAAVFDMDKLKWVNAQHLRAYSIDDLKPIVLKALTGTDQPIVPMSILDESLSKPLHFDSFSRLATKIAQRDMEVTTDSLRLVGSCLQYDINTTLVSDEHVIEVLQSPSLPIVISTLIKDFDSQALPQGMESNFTELWKTYMKSLGKQLGLKGKELFHPVRLSLTGRMSGPDVGDQLQLIALSEGLLHPSYKATLLKDRIELLRSFSITDSIAIASKSVSDRSTTVE